MCYKTVYAMFDLKRFRKDFRLTQKETAFILECGQPNIVAIEKDKKDLTHKQLQTLQEKYGNLENYIVSDEDMDDDSINDDDNNINDNCDGDINNGQSDNVEDEIDKWDKLVTKHQETIERLLSIIEAEKKEKMKLIETISNLSSLILEKKAV